METESDSDYLSSQSSNFSHGSSEKAYNVQEEELQHHKYR